MVYILTFYVRTQVFEKTTFYMPCTKKTKKYSIRSHVVASKFIFFTGDTEK
jgi:hypothetical protein